YCPPTPVHFFDENGLTWPYVNGITLTFNEYHKREYVIDKTQKYPVQFFVQGDKYHFPDFLDVLKRKPKEKKVNVDGKVVVETMPLSSSQEEFNHSIDKLKKSFSIDIRLFGVEEEGRIFLFGADSRGRDIFSRLLYGGWISLSIGLIGVVISFSLGLIVGGLSGYYGGWVDNLLMRICEMFMMIPGFYLLLALRSAVPDDFNSVQIYFTIIIILSFIGWAGLARIIRGMCLSLRERDYVLAAKSFGLSDFSIIIKHVLPHTLSYSIFAVMLSIPGYILGESALSLIGLGIQDPFASWGNMLADAMSTVRIKFAPWILWPAAFIFVTVVCFNVIGDALRDCLDPMLKSERSS
ncbi:MAG: ABC transporter permease, partial [Candidatus Omnitrophica bacterium]|nr:ABC transporter permease [Candidatus Omnitrophota bacterium]